MFPSAAAIRGWSAFRSHRIVMAGLVPAISMMEAPRHPDRDRRIKAGDDD
jgi:hypothetical protein